MCHNHRTIYTACGHVEEHVTLCHYSLKPLVRRAASYPYISALQIPPQHPKLGDPNHDVVLTAETKKEQCEDCRLPDLNVWHLDEMAKELGYRVNVDIDNDDNQTEATSHQDVSNGTLHSTSSNTKEQIGYAKRKDKYLQSNSARLSSEKALPRPKQFHPHLATGVRSYANKPSATSPPNSDPRLPKKTQPTQCLYKEWTGVLKSKRSAKL